MQKSPLWQGEGFAAKILSSFKLVLSFSGHFSAFLQQTFSQV